MKSIALGAGAARGPHMAALRSRSPAAQLGQGCRPEGRLGCGWPPHRRGRSNPFGLARPRRPPAIGGPVRGALRAAAFIPAPARSRAPRPPDGGRPAQTTATLPESGILHLMLAASPFARRWRGGQALRSLAPKKKQSSVMEEFNCGGKENSPDLPRVSQKSKPLFSPLVGEFPLPLFECRKTCIFATLGEGRAGVKPQNPPLPPPQKKAAGLPFGG